jgi:hypothetical protein
MESGSLLELRRAVCGAASRFDPGVLDRTMAERAVHEWTAIANAASAAQAMAAARVAECGTPPGCVDAAEWLAKQTGTSTTKAKETLRTGNGMRSQPGTREAATDGGLSPDQTAAITDAVAHDPGAESRLVEAAGSASLSELRDQCAKAKAAADPDPAETERRIHRNRRLRRYRDAEGAEHLHATGTKEDMAKVDQALKPLLDDIFAAKRAEGAREPLEAYLFDAFVRLAEGAQPDITDRAGRPKIRYLGLLRVDWEALIRGSSEAEEVCEIAGLGPISVETARRLLSEAILKLVITKGDDVMHVNPPRPRCQHRPAHRPAMAAAPLYPGRLWAPRPPRDRPPPGLRPGPLHRAHEP